MTRFLDSVDQLAREVPDRGSLAVPPDYSGCAMAAVRALIRRGARDLHLLGIPQLGFQGDMLIGAGCVSVLEAAALTLGEFGAAPRFIAALKSGAIRMRDSTCPAIHAGLQAAEKGIPFMPLRGILDSDVLAHRDDWKIVDNPFTDDDPMVALPAIRPTVALFHAPLADRRGNVWIGVRRELMLAAHASECTLVSAEEITDIDLLDDERYAPGTIPALYVSAIAAAPNGAWPVGLAGRYPPDATHLARYVELAQTEDGFRRYLDEHVFDAKANAGVQA
ncbi:MAG: CoA-transferase [Gammaproteobacteria bacterium]|nr:CoA-transferase [Gammaproteobacteria bacterium]